MQWSRNVREPVFGPSAAGHRLVTSALAYTVGGQGRQGGPRLDNCGAAAPLANGNLAVVDTHNRRILLLDGNGEHLATVSHKEKLRLPWGIVASRNGEGFYVTDGELNCLIQMNNDGEMVSSFPLSIIQEAGPLAISPRDGHLYIADLTSTKVGIYDPTNGCQLVRIVFLESPDDSSPAEHIAVNADENLLVTYGTAGRHVQVYNETGQLSSAFGEFLCPSGLFITGQNNTIITDREDKSVHLYTSEGRFVQVLLNQSTGLPTHPHGVCLTRNGQMVLNTSADFHSYPDRLYVFKLQAAQ